MPLPPSMAELPTCFNSTASFFVTLTSFQFSFVNCFFMLPSFFKLSPPLRIHSFHCFNNSISVLFVITLPYSPIYDLDKPDKLLVLFTSNIFCYFY